MRQQIVGGSLVSAVDALQEIGRRLPCGNAGIHRTALCGKDEVMAYNGLARALMVACGAFVLFLLGSPQNGSAAPDGIVLAPHRAIYELTLATTRGGTGVSSVLGRMAYDLTGSPCEGYTQNMRFVTRMTNQSGNAVVTDLRSSTWEDARGKRFRFELQPVPRREGNRHHRRRRRPARHQRRHQGRADQARKEEHFDSLARVFPGSAHDRPAECGQGTKTSFRADLYDGSEKGEKVYDTVAAIGRAQAAGSNRQLAQVKNAERLDGLKGWPVSIAYFEPGAGKQDALPVYELSFLMFENGVSRKLYIDYGEFALQGDLTEITFYPPSKCETK